jgi:hypothetical protein
VASGDSKEVDLADLNPEFRRRLGNFLTAASAAGIPAHIIEAYRSNAVQAQYYAEKQQGLRPYPVAPPGGSFHNYGYAADTLADDRSRQQALIDYANAHPEFGIAPLPGDAPHFQIAGYKHVSDLLANPPAYGGGAQPDLTPFIAANQGYTIGKGYTPGQTAVAASAQPSRPGSPTPGTPLNDFYHTAMMHESGGKNIPNSAGGWGAAGGYYQFTPPTWASVRAAHPELKLPANVADANQDQQTAAYHQLVNTNVQALQGANLPINDKNIFMASFLGGGGATKFLTAMNQNPGASAADLFPAEAKANPTVFYANGKPRSLNDVYALQTGQFGTSNTTGFGPNATPGTTLNSSPVAAGGPAASPATPATQTAGTTLPGFQPGSPANKMAQDALKSLAGGGATDEPPPMQLQQAQSQAMGGPMMMRQGGQNMEPRMAAMQALAQQGFMTQPSVAAFGGGGLQSPVPPAMPGGVTGMPASGIAGTTLNSPSQLQMALMTGALSPYDMYARQAGS